MGVYIKGMDMPESCHQCVAGYGGFCFVCPAEEDGTCPDHGRPEWCPLIELPPHGRLIDADALWKEIKSKDNGLKIRPKGESVMYDAGFLAGYRAAAQIASKMPTIIPAEEVTE